ncbi:hypothetical protein Tco_0853380 [Tanacetum coccineum]
MMTYLKHIGYFKHSDLNRKKFEEIQTLYERQKTFDQIFIPIDSVEDEKMNKKASGMDKEEVAKEPESTKVKGPKENIRKRSGRRLKMKATKRVFKAYGSSRWINTFSEMIKLFDRMDLVEIHNLVMKRFATTPPKNQEEWNLQSWIFYENCGVHVLRLEDGTEINMLADRRYPLTKNTLERMLDLTLTVVSDDDALFDLLRFIEKQIDEFRGQDRNISRDDLTKLYRLVMQRYGTNGPEDEYERVFWGDLKTMFDTPLSTDPVWNLPCQQKMLS